MRTIVDRYLPELANASVIFVHVVDAGGFSAAARRLGIAKSMVSKQVARLEQSVGTRLLQRSTRSMSLTEAGTAFYARAAQAVTLLDEARAAVGSLATTPRGTLRITTSVAFGKLCLTPLLADFVARYPEISLQLALLDRNVDLVEEGYDIALRLTPAPPEHLAGRRLMPIDYVVCTTPAYLARHPVAAPAELVQANCLYYGYGDFGDTWHFERKREKCAVRVAGNIVVNSSEAVRDLVLAGLGIGLVARYAVAQELRDGRLVQLLPDWKPVGPFGQVAWALWAPQASLPPKMRVFVDYLVERLT